MIQRVHIQILDAQTGEDFPAPYDNRLIADELKKDMIFYYPSFVSVEYIDLLFDNEGDFSEIRELLMQGAIKTPVVLINGVPKIHGGIPLSVIKEEVEKMLSSGPLH